MNSIEKKAKISTENLKKVEKEMPNELEKINQISKELDSNLSSEDNLDKILNEIFNEISELENSIKSLKTELSFEDNFWSSNYSNHLISDLKRIQKEKHDFFQKKTDFLRISSDFDQLNQLALPKGIEIKIIKENNLENNFQSDFSDQMQIENLGSNYFVHGIAGNYFWNILYSYNQEKQEINQIKFQIERKEMNDDFNENQQVNHFIEKKDEEIENLIDVSLKRKSVDIFLNGLSLLSRFDLKRNALFEKISQFASDNLIFSFDNPSQFSVQSNSSPFGFHFYWIARFNCFGRMTKEYKIIPIFIEKVRKIDKKNIIQDFEPNFLNLIKTEGLENALKICVELVQKFSD
ncbi:hypothetical protein M0811_04464 [Anaeramoeba ignava]|uniref:Uncharacterized protein n=1 Tax=Anaeramoeba ignava TaxID=1746090 RepID=A0A9Q0LUT4_ANAIG|nr:hypothetical protein M0811_04464 [Anaeramoeba ignava]